MFSTYIKVYETPLNVNYARPIGIVVGRISPQRRGRGLLKYSPLKSASGTRRNGTEDDFDENGEGGRGAVNRWTCYDALKAGDTYVDPAQGELDQVRRGGGFGKKREDNEVDIAPCNMNTFKGYIPATIF